MPVRLELSGKKFGWLTVIGFSHADKYRLSYWDVVCRCGEKKKVRGAFLTAGHTTSCGCKVHPNLLGQRFDRGLVIKKAGVRNGYQRWLLKCDCGNEYIAETGQLRNKNTKSCGCLMDSLRRRSGKDSLLYKGYKDISLGFWGKIKWHAKERELPFDITIEYAWDKFIEQDKKCALSGVDIELFDSPVYGRKNTASIDRKYNSLGYTKSNIQWVHKHMNRMKWTHDQDYFIELCRTVAKNNQPSEVVSF